MSRTVPPFAFSTPTALCPFFSHLNFQHRFSFSFFLFSINSSCSISPFSLFSFFCSQTLIRNKYYVAHDRNKPPFTFFLFLHGISSQFSRLSLTYHNQINIIHNPLALSPLFPSVLFLHNSIVYQTPPPLRLCISTFRNLKNSKS